MSQRTLTDAFGRRIHYLRLSVTDRCDLRCRYCLPKGYKGFEASEHWLTFDEIVQVVRAFAALGVRHVRLTGGEPLLRRELPLLAARLATLPGLDDLSLSTNGTRLKSLAKPLYAAGVRRLNISLDSLRPDVFKQITGGCLDQVLRGIQAAQRVGFAPIRINTLFMPGVNDDELEELIDYCGARGFTLRLIEAMPMGATGQAAAGHSLDPHAIQRRLAQRVELLPELLPGGGPARYYRLSGTETHIGFISPRSQHFCQTCNRVRLTVVGTLRLCLGQEHSAPLRVLLRAGISDAELSAHLQRVIALKPERHHFNESPTPITRFMSATGG
ncbi:GTP 3',8-cyclase MoaA [Thiorhodococcus mannitoliphagus]|uniref:GTP 3',8-cyclase n=1 Tax=Thiorhodococcus mannitoliphagus TaxID=329406 RepID=A0A6P1DXG3_9GAMM|nr:GTP 3',8-cyclase MoaA [Thiorhodococcus mannitoliphagus]NEX22170.1 GTP 3',8-cyclase MoaA [Thiorhodococcus mannitoliphagus]